MWLKTCKILFCQHIWLSCVVVVVVVCCVCAKIKSKRVNITKRNEIWVHTNNNNINKKKIKESRSKTRKFRWNVCVCRLMCMKVSDIYGKLAVSTLIVVILYMNCASTPSTSVSIRSLNWNSNVNGFHILVRFPLL